MDARPVKGFPGYTINAKGEVFRDGKTIKHNYSVEGYPYIKLSKNGELTTGYIHKLMGEAGFVKGDKPSKNAIVNHKDGDKKNLSLDNLEWASLSDNTSHAFANGLEAPPNGEINGKSKISDAEASEIRAAVKSGKQKNKIAKEYGISPAMVTRMTTKGTEKSPARRQRDGSTRLHREFIDKIDNILFGK